MKSYFQIALLVCCLPAFGAHSAAFQNLGFESASLVPIPDDPYNRVYFDQAFPGWTGYVGPDQNPRILVNGTFLCCSAISLFSDGRPAIEGTFGVALQGARRLEDNQVADTALAQTGLVPNDAQSLQFRARIYRGPFEVELGGQALSLVPLFVTADYTLFGADVSPWAGQESELRFTAPGQIDSRDDTSVFLDSISFSTTPVPEPSTFALFAVAGAVGWFCYRRKLR